MKHLQKRNAELISFVFLGKTGLYILVIIIITILLQCLKSLKHDIFFSQIHALHINKSCLQLEEALASGSRRSPQLG